MCESILWGENILGVQFHPEFMEWNEKEKFFDLINQWISGKPFYTKKVKGEVREKKRKEVDYSSLTVDMRDRPLETLRISGTFTMTDVNWTTIPPGWEDSSLDRIVLEDTLDTETVEVL